LPNLVTAGLRHFQHQGRGLYAKVAAITMPPRPSSASGQPMAASPLGIAKNNSRTSNSLRTFNGRWRPSILHAYCAIRNCDRRRRCTSRMRPRCATDHRLCHTRAARLRRPQAHPGHTQPAGM